MLIAFQVILLIVIILTVLGVIAEKEKIARDHLTGLSLAALVACLLTFVLF